MLEDLDFYGEDKSYAIKPVYEEPEVVSNYELIDSKDPKDKKHIDPDEALRDLALSLNPKHSDLYPLEVLGVYHLVLKENFHGLWNGGNPETFIDDKIIKWANESNATEFTDKLSKAIQSNDLIREAFQLRLNYAWCLQENVDTISIHTKKSGYLTFKDKLDNESFYIGDLQSPYDLDEEELDRLADAFYNNKKHIKEDKLGTPKEIRDRIEVLMNNAGLKLNKNLNEVYNQLNKFNKEHLEEGLIGRISYLIFIGEHSNIKYIK